jgi:hypothetical protein
MIDERKMKHDEIVSRPHTPPDGTAVSFTEQTGLQNLQASKGLR